MEDLMSDDLITVDNLTVDFIKSIFDAAMMETRVDVYGQLQVSETNGLWLYVLPFKEAARIQLLIVYSTEGVKYRILDFVNDMNTQYIIIRTSIRDNDRINFDYDINVQGGLVKKNLVFTAKRFLSIPPMIMSDELPKYASSTMPSISPDVSGILNKK
jgi:hypothetical protein